jgi:hypothetical protein
MFGQGHVCVAELHSAQAGTDFLICHREQQIEHIPPHMFITLN